MRMRKRRRRKRQQTHTHRHSDMSLAWRFFTVSEEDKKFVICNTCKAKVNRGGTNTKTFGTTNLIRHLQHRHPAEHAQFEEASKERAATPKANQSSVPDTNQQPLLSLLGMSSEKTKAITRKILESMALDEQRFPIVENRGTCTCLSAVHSLKPRSQSQHGAQPTVPQPYGAVRKKFVTMAPVDWSAHSVQSAVCSLKTKPQPQPQPLPQPTTLQSHYGVVKKEFVTMAPVDWSAHSVQSAVGSLKPRRQSEHLPQPTVLPSDDEQVRRKPVTTAPVLHPQSVKDNESSTSHSLPVLRHVATQTDPAERRSVGTQQTNVRSIATQATVPSRDCGVCTLTFPLDSPLLFLQPVEKRPAKRPRLKDKDKCISECSLSLVVHEPEDSTRL